MRNRSTPHLSAMCTRYNFFCFFVLVLLASVSHAQTKQEIRIGLIAPATGNLATWTADVLRATKLSEQFFSERSKRFTYQLVLEDGQGGVGNAAASAAQKLISVENVRLLLVAISGEVLQAAPIAERTHSVLIAFAGTHPAIRNAGAFIFRTYVDMERGIQSMITHLEKSKISRLGILSEETSFTQGIKNLLVGALGDRVVVQEDFPVDSSDFRSVLLRVAAKSPDGIFLNAASPRSYQALLRQMRGMRVTLPLFAYQSPAHASSLAELGKVQDGVVFFGLPEERESSADYKEFRSRYVAQFGDKIETEFLLRSFFDAFQSIALAAEKVGTDPEKIRVELGQLSFAGATGPVSFDEQGDIRDLSFTLSRIVDGKPVAVRE